MAFVETEVGILLPEELVARLEREGALGDLRAFDADRIISFRLGGELWQGGVSSVEGAKARGFDVVVLCAEESQFDSPSDRRRLRYLEVVRFPTDDCPLTPEHLERAKDVATLVARRVRGGKKVLVTCHAGWNRSGLVVALATRLLTKRSGKMIAERIRQKRGPRALGNRSFAAYVEAMP